MCGMFTYTVCLNSQDQENFLTWTVFWFIQVPLLYILMQSWVWVFGQFLLFFTVVDFVQFWTQEVRYLGKNNVLDSDDKVMGVSQCKCAGWEGSCACQQKVCVCSNANPLHYYVLRILRKADRWH